MKLHEARFQALGKNNSLQDENKAQHDINRNYEQLGVSLFSNEI